MTVGSDRLNQNGKSFLRRSALGKLGESLAREYLERKGYEVIRQNAKIGRHDEIDLIVRKEGVIVFVEVKTRASDKFGAPEESITARKRQSIERAIATYVKQHPEIEAVRFDVIAIFIQSSGRKTLKHFSAVGGSLAFL